MVNSAAIPAPPVALVDVLNDLLDSELSSIFRFMGEGSPYLSRATADIRKPLAEMVHSSQRRAGELYALIESLGGTPVSRGLQPEEQYLAFLSLKFLLPKLVAAKELEIRRYETAIGAIGKGPGTAGEIVGTLNSHLSRNRDELQSLNRASADIARK